MGYYCNSTEIRVEKSNAQNRKNLVFIRSGSEKVRVFGNNNLTEARNFDIAINYYSDPVKDCGIFEQAEFILGGGLSKYHAAKLFFLQQNLLDKYEIIAFVDDDVEFRFNVSEFFEFFRDVQAVICQPSLSCDSFFNWHISRNHPGLLYRMTNFVEVMSPFFKKEFLNRCITSFDKSISTWGLDILWGGMLAKHESAAVIDKFQMAHRKPVDSKNGPFYKYLNSIGIDPFSEMSSIMNEMGIKEYICRPKSFHYFSDIIRI